MRSRLTKLGAAIAALGALAVGGSALASAADSPPVQQNQDSGANVQQGDQSVPDTGQAGEQAGEEANSESSSESSAASDGPGGYADTVANADTQQTGEH